jgi:hypothetical protein
MHGLDSALQGPDLRESALEDTPPFSSDLEHRPRSCKEKGMLNLLRKYGPVCGLAAILIACCLAYWSHYHTGFHPGDAHSVLTAPKPVPPQAEYLSLTGSTSTQAESGADTPGYIGIGISTSNFNTSQRAVAAPMPVACTATNLAVSLGTPPSDSKTWTFTIYDGASPTLVTCTTSTDGASCAYTGPGYDFAAGHLISLQAASTTTTPTTIRWSATCQVEKASF